MRDFLFNWQSLIGSMIGAAVPLCFWFFIKWYEGYRDQKNHLVYLEKTLVININNLYDIRISIETFINERLIPLISLISSRGSVYSTDTAFFPLFFSGLISENVIEKNIKSNYIENKIALLLKMSKDFTLMIEDSREQFRYVVHLSKDMALQKSNLPVFHNQEYKINMENFKKVLEEDIIGKNIKFYMRELILTRTAVDNFRKAGLIRWRLKFTPSFRYFKNKKAFLSYKEQGFERVDEFVKEQTARLKGSIGDIYRSVI